MEFHQHHREIASEAFARPATQVSAPSMVTRLSVAPRGMGNFHDLAADHMLLLCRDYGQAPPDTGSRHFVLDTGDWKLIWERHTEFLSYTVIAPGTPTTMWQDNALSRVPEDWLARIPGEIVSATNMIVQRADPDEDVIATARELLGTSSFCAMQAPQKPVTVAADFRPDEERFVRMLVFDAGEGDAFLGRLVQRLLEIDFYRMAALLTLPVARGLGREVKQMEDELSALLIQMGAESNAQADTSVLEGLTRLATRLEQLEHDTRFRFDAGQAYHQIVLDRVDRLREVRVEGHQRLGTFMETRLAPAMRTCNAAQGRLQSLAGRVARAVDLLSTRVSVSIERQNAERLEAMNTRADAQLRLQETVEGLSTVAITYYAVGLVHYLLKALAASGGPDIAYIGTGLAIPLILVSVFIGIKRVRKKITGK